ncbi:MAG TPA: glutamate--tRNA ligase [bacterium]|nr:glutamate--tRNA ligase [bacterium]
MKFRARFAPSPTGYLHIGGLRTALYNYLFARHHDGVFFLRLEDTDQTRYVPGADKKLVQSLHACGLNWDEGIDLNEADEIVDKGDFGPYTQSQRKEIYQKYIQELLANGKAYYCFCSAERLEELRTMQQNHNLPPKYDKHCVNLSPEEVQAKIAAGEKYVIRLKVEENRTIEFTDLIRGPIAINSNDIDDQVLIKSDGLPTYHFANIVDDHLMGSTHVIRGEEWISSTPKHVLLYEAFGWEKPQFAHLPLLLNPDKSKLSKRQGDVAVEDYLAKGYLPEALVNFVALLGWNPGDDREIFTLDELVKEFSLEKCGKSGAVFDLKKLDWMNGIYIRQLSEQALVNKAKPYLLEYLGDKKNQWSDDYLNKVILVQRDRLNKLSDIAADDLSYFFGDDLSYDPALLIWKKSDKEKTVEHLKSLQSELTAYAGEWSIQALNDYFIAWIKGNGWNNGDVLWPLRVALCGQEKSPSPFELLWVLGKEKGLERLQKAINLL